MCESYTVVQCEKMRARGTASSHEVLSSTKIRAYLEGGQPVAALVQRRWLLPAVGRCLAQHLTGVSANRETSATVLSPEPCDEEDPTSDEDMLPADIPQASFNAPSSEGKPSGRGTSGSWEREGQEALSSALPV